MNYCPFCGFQIKLDSQFCGNCGQKIPQVQPTSRPIYPEPQIQQHQPYLDRFPLYSYRSGNKADVGERFISFLIDSCIAGGLMYAFCLGWLYVLGKDYIREGQSIGKGIMALRVIDFNTGMPATISQSFVRNCVCGCVDVSCCFIVAMIDEDGRRIGDHMAGTVVIKDL